jgi:DNA-binding NtrC family response regulator
MLEELQAETGKKIEFISNQHMDFLLSYSWPGNIKELRSLKDVLEHTNGRIRGHRGAAEILGLNESTLRFRMKKLGIR